MEPPVFGILEPALTRLREPSKALKLEQFWPHWQGALADYRGQLTRGPVPLAVEHQAIGVVAHAIERCASSSLLAGNA